MKRSLATLTVAAVALLAGHGARAQEADAEAKPPATEESPGPRLRVRFLETRQKGDKITTVPSCTVLLHTGEKGAYVFVGTQVGLRTSDRAAPAVMFKNAGVQAKVTAEPLPDGRFRIDASFEKGSVLGADGATTFSNEGNPVLRVVKGESRVLVRPGETVPLASAVDTVTGELVRVDVVVEPAPATAPAARLAANGKVVAHLALRRRQGATLVASRPYSVVVPVDEGREANVFSGAMLPLEVTYQGQTTVMLKDIGAGATFGASRTADGRYRVDLSLSDGTLAAASGTPRVQAFQVESRLYLSAGEPVPVATAVDPQTGDVVEAELKVEVAP